jgi:hypothetical protein
MAETHYRKLEKWATTAIGKKWKAEFCRRVNCSQSNISAMKNRRRLGLVTTIKISKHTGIPLSELGYPELRGEKQ